MSALLPNLVRFGGVLRRLGLAVPAGRMIDAAQALTHVDIGRRSDFYFTLLALLVQREQDRALFEEAFRTFWRRPAREWTDQDLRAMGEQRRVGPPEPHPQDTDPHAGAGAPGTSDRVEAIERIAPFSYSASSVSRRKDFALFSEEELAQASAAVAALAWNPGERRTRRWQSASSGAVDIRRALAHSARTGEVLVLPARSRRSTPRSLIVLCDVSGSMERYSRILLHFVHSLSAGARVQGVRRRGRLGHVESFLFATALTRVTAHVTRHGPDGAVRRILRQMPDWSGGTRIGDALRVFNVRWARRVAGHRPVVLLISDGWDRGEPGVLRQEMARLHRSSHRVIWLNPLLGSPEYQPLTRGMQAALPFIDDFLPVHNLESLEHLAAHLNALAGDRRRARRGGVTRLIRSA